MPPLNCPGLLQVHGFPKVMGVLTHLDGFKVRRPWPAVHYQVGVGKTVRPQRACSQYCGVCALRCLHSARCSLTLLTRLFLVSSNRTPRR